MFALHDTDCGDGIGRPGTLCVGAAGRSAAVCCVRGGVSRGKLNTHTHRLTDTLEVRRRQLRAHLQVPRPVPTTGNRAVLLYIKWSGWFTPDIGVGVLKRERCP